MKKLLFISFFISSFHINAVHAGCEDSFRSIINGSEVAFSHVVGPRKVLIEEADSPRDIVEKNDSTDGPRKVLIEEADVDGPGNIIEKDDVDGPKKAL